MYPSLEVISAPVKKWVGERNFVILFAKFLAIFAY